LSQREQSSLLGICRVLDLSDEKGVLCGKVLADLGADVIKIEPPGGDTMRKVGPFYHDEVDLEKSLYWFTFNTSKRSITLDISHSNGQPIFRELVKTADIIIECFPPGYLKQLGLDYPALSKINPGIIMTSITPFGQNGPYSGYKACDIVGLAMGGLLYLNGEPHRPPVRIRAQQAYAQASVQAAAGTMVAYYYREISGEGQHIDVSMQEAVSNTIDTAQQAWDLQRKIYTRVAPYRPLGDFRLRCVYKCKDGYVACWAPEEPREIAKWMEDNGIEYDTEEMERRIVLREKVASGEMTLAEAFTQEELTVMQESRIPLLEMLTKQQIYDYVLEKGFGWAPVSSPRDLVENEQLKARDYYVDVEHPELGTSIRYPGAPYKIKGTPWKIWNRAPRIGEHNSEIYGDELGLTEEELVKMQQLGVI